jgi:predicted nucleotidyltransferase
MDDLSERKKEFKERFTQDALDTPGVTDIKFFGSFEEPRWKRGKSDIDIYVGGDVSKEDRRALTEDVIKLSDLYDLDLENACYEHPTPVFDKYPYSQAFKKVAYGEPIDGQSINMLGNVYRKTAKEICVPHKLIWKIQGLI